VAWIGFDQPHNLGERETGGAGAAIWLEYMAARSKGQAMSTASATGGGDDRRGDLPAPNSPAGQGVASLGVDDASRRSRPSSSENVF